ncbi:TonB-dependent receptor [Roseibium aggregatum]|uniref:TonB-dependent receptor n=1 Tax=Roseibium aggregatum TaxID=187304 RepID=A0A939IYF2_9HYPH|nr:TonB-dependent receptor [Roseibium aggregatum]MBN9668906.1 TonB-dependent receptor [Roseibium aggregatum]
MPRLAYPTLLGSAALLPLLAALPNVARADETETVLEVIVISPNLWKEQSQKATASATTLTSDDLPAGPSSDQTEIARHSANVVFQKSNADERLVVRGVTAFDNALADPVGYSVNGVSLPLGSIQMPALFAIDQVTLLKGPQGTLYGRNSEAGLVSVETIAPGSLGGWRAGIGTSASAGAATPIGLNGNVLFSDTISDTLALTLGLDFENSPGVMRDPVSGADDGGENRRLTWAAGLAYDPSADTNVTFTSVGNREDMNKRQFRYIDGLYATDRFENSYNDDAWEARTSTVTSLKASHAFEAVELTSITGATTFDRAFDLDFDTSLLPLGQSHLDVRDRMISQEFRLINHQGTGSPLNWSLGAHAFHQSTDAGFAIDTQSSERQTAINQNGAALFGFAEYALTDRLRFGAGTRLDWQESEATQRYVSALGTSTYDGSLSTFAILPKATLAFDLSENALVYANVARGFMPGGYNYGFANDTDSLVYDPEYSWSGEIGTKMDLAGDRVQLNLAAFYTYIEDKQITQTIPGASQSISNAAEAYIYGAEAELRARIGAGWSLRAAAGLQQATASDLKTTVYDSATATLVAADYSGNDLPLAPNVSYSLGLAYEGQNGWSGKVSLNGTGSYYFDPANSLEQSAFATVDAEISYAFNRNKVTLWARNLFDTPYYSKANSSVLGTVVEDGQPITVGLNYRITW